MKKVLLLLFIFLVMNNLFSINIEFRDSNERVRLSSTKIGELDYFSLSELRNVLRTANHFIDYEHNKINFSIFNESVILYMNTFFVSSRGRLSNLSYPIVKRNGEFFLPETFFTRTLEEFFPDRFTWNSSRRVLITDRPPDRRIRTIVIDPGHGGRDPGAVGRRSQEKNIVLDIALGLRTKLVEELGVNVLLTRSTDEFVSLRDRTTFANRNNGDMFISLHLNASQNRSAHGIEVYFLSAARTDEARAVELRENRVVYEFEGGAEAVRAYDDLAFILADLLQAEQLEESSDLAVRLQTELVSGTGAPDRGVKQAGLYVLRGAFMPAVLVELGFISNPAEEDRLLSREYQNRLISAMVAGVRSFKLKYDYLW